MTKKLLSAALALSLLFLTACGASEPETTGSAESTTSVSATEATTEPVQTEGSTLSTQSDPETEPSGATAETSAPETAASETSAPATEPVQTEPAAYSFVFDPYSISSEYADLYGEEFITAYRGLADAFINYETTCPCESEEIFTALFAAVETCMPYFSSDAVLTYDAFDPDTKTLTIHYRSASKAEHDAAYAGFVSSVESYFQNGLTANDGDLIKAINIYRNFTSVISYDLAVDNVSAYKALTDHVGIAHSFAQSYAYLLRQAGIEANTCGGLSSDGSAAHEWVVFKLDGLWFYADPTYENGETGGFGLSYFGTNNAERKDAGYDPTYFGVGATGQLWAKDLFADGNNFDFLRGSTSFVIDRNSSTLTLSNGVSVNFTELPGGIK